MLSTGNSQQVAGTVNGKFDMRRGPDAFGASLVGNYGEGAAPPQELHVTTENLQGRLRYERYVSDRVSFFLIGTARHDRFQGLDVRFNVDPGVKYIFLDGEATKLWSELGYDFQEDIRRSDALTVTPATPTMPAVLLDKTEGDHSGRLFVGFRHAFSKDVTFSTGIEYLQSFVHSTQYRINYDALFAASLGAGFSVGVGFTARYDHSPLPTKLDLDTGTTFSLIYAMSDIPPPPPPPPPPCNCPPPPPPPSVSPPSTAPAAAPSPSAAPTSTN